MYCVVPELTSSKRDTQRDRHGTIVRLNQHLPSTHPVPSFLVPQPVVTLSPFPPGTSLVSLGRYLINVDKSENGAHPCFDQLATAAQDHHLAARVVPLEDFTSKAHLLLADCDGVQPLRDVCRLKDKVFLILGKTHGDLHNFLKERKRLSEVEAAPVFWQIVSLVAAAHSTGLALRDLKLKKFVFTDAQRTILKLQNLEDAQFLDQSGGLSERHGCPAYVCPEMLQPGSYSGRAADLWSLGVILYTLLVGHYPFFDTNPQNLFEKIRSGYYNVPDSVSYLVRTLISSLLCYDPERRVSARAILEHPWFSQASDEPLPPPTAPLDDQTVPSHKLC